MIEVNGVSIGSKSRDVLQIFSMFSDLKYWSRDALINLFKGVFEMAIEVAETEPHGYRFIKDANNRLELFDATVGGHDSNWIISKIYNELLRSEGLSASVRYGR